MKELHLIGYGSGIAGANPHGGEGPWRIQQSPDFKKLIQTFPIVWNTMIQLDTNLPTKLRMDEKVRNLCESLANKVAELVHQQQFFTVLGGDHTCAIGTWSGAYAALQQKGELGLIWIDAHMDSHTPETSESGNLHGMPLATLMGLGYSTLTSILTHTPKLKPENICLVGIRSFEKGEAELLKRLNVRIYFMDEIKQRGLQSVLEEAVQHVSRETVHYGVSIDLDSIDPEEAPGVSVSEPDGIHASELYSSLSSVFTDPKLLGIEIVEFDPQRDKNQLTEKIIIHLLELITKSRQTS